MPGIRQLEEYIPNPGVWIDEGVYALRITLDESAERGTYAIDLCVKQRDTKEGDLIKLRVGMGKDKPAYSDAHPTDRPHFEMSIYERRGPSFGADIYFTFAGVPAETLLAYAKGTLVIIAKILGRFFGRRGLGQHSVLYEEAVLPELSASEPILIDALYRCYQEGTMIARQKGHDPVVIRTAHSLGKYLGSDDLLPLSLPLLELVRRG